MKDQEKKNKLIKFNTQYPGTYIQATKNKCLNPNLSKKNLIKNRKNNIVVYSSNNFLQSKNKEIPSDKSIKYYNKNNKIFIDNFSQDEKLINNSVNINLINSMNNITFCDTNANNSKLNLKKNSNITVNKKINLTKDKHNDIKYKNFGINIALKGLKENNNIFNNSIINQKIKQKEKEKIINVNKSSINKYKKDLKIINSSSNIFSIGQNKLKNKNNYHPHHRSPKNLNSNLSISINKTKSEEKNFKKSKKNNRYNNIFISNFDDKINNIFITGNNTTTNNNNNLNKHFFTGIKYENKKNSKEKKINLKISNFNIYSNTISSNKKFNKSSPFMYKNKINHNIINSFDKIEVNKKLCRKDTETRNESFNLYLENTHQNSWSNSKEKINSLTNLDNAIYYNKKEKEKKIEKTPKNISPKVIYNKKQLSIHNKMQSFNDINKILSPSFAHKKKLLSENLDKLYGLNDNNYENINNLAINDFTYKKKIPMKNIYKKPEIGSINNSFLLIGKDALINKNNLNQKKQYSEKIEENTKQKFNVKLNKFLKKNEPVTEINKDKTEFSILLNSENNNNSKEITMDTNMNLNEISIIAKINNKVINNYNFTKKYYIYFVKVNKEDMKKPCFISKKRIDRNILKISKIPKKAIYYITKTRKIYFNIIPKIDICYFKKTNIDTTYDLSYVIKPLLSERTSKNENNDKYKAKVIHTTKKIVNIEKYDNNYATKKNLKKTEKGLNILEKIADKRISLSSLLIKKSKRIFDNNIKNDFIENLNKISNANYEIILNQISNLIISSNKGNNINISEIIKNQYDFIDIIINKGIKEKKYIKIYAKLCKDLFVTLMTIIDKYNNDIDIFDEITKEKSLKKLIKVKIMTLLKEVNFESEIIFYFICELLGNKIFSIKSGFEILDLLFKQYMNDLNIMNLSGIEILLKSIKKIIYEKNNLEHIQRYNKYIKTHLYNIFQKNSKSLPKYLYYRIYNLLQNNKKEFIPPKQDCIDNKIFQMIKSDLEYIINNNHNTNKNIFNTRLKDKYDIEFNKNKSFELYEFFYYYIENCIDLINSDNKVKLANEYINNFINDFSSSISNEVWEILHYKLISLYLDVNEICVDNIYMYQIMGYLMYTLLNNKLFYIKDLNNFLEKENYIIINIAKVVKYCIIFAEKNAKKFHNDFKQTKLFFGNDIFYSLVTLPLKKKFYEI